MATTTFDKRIIIDEEAADRLIAVLNKPALPRPNTEGKMHRITEEDTKCFLQNRSAKLSAQRLKDR
jgi:hypothetical protein